LKISFLPENFGHSDPPLGAQRIYLRPEWLLLLLP